MCIATETKETNSATHKFCEQPSIQTLIQHWSKPCCKSQHIPPKPNVGRMARDARIFAKKYKAFSRSYFHYLLR
jgi:hypothetical protein